MLVNYFTIEWRVFTEQQLQIDIPLSPLLYLTLDLLFLFPTLIPLSRHTTQVGLMGPNSCLPQEH